uniref:Uncharacterized protein n=1 Tax=Pseudomonas phage Ulina01 TaxID=3138549 RepID=A0AAU6W005_9CAUD
MRDIFTAFAIALHAHDKRLYSKWAYAGLFTIYTHIERDTLGIIARKVRAQ